MVVFLISGLKGSGKDTLGNLLQERLYKDKYEISHLADSLKDIAKIIHNFTHEQLNGNLKEVEYHDDILGMTTTPRKVLQKLGTEIFRNNYSPDIWIKILCRNLTGNDIICDVRFENEAEDIKAYALARGWKVVHILVERDGLVSHDNHASERMAIEKKYSFDYILRNPGNIQNYFNNMVIMLKNI